ncbi:metal-sensing transcriptional repressor [Patescibacteria group bacterium]|nr:metal-sensing transcriptional repressor [Patescibacteria group bacterium]
MPKSPLKKELRLKGLSDSDYKVIKRLLNLRGQVDGLVKMIGDKRDLSVLILQFKSIKGMINKAAKIYMADHMNQLLKYPKEERMPKKKRDVMRELIKEISRY